MGRNGTSSRRGGYTRSGLGSKHGGAEHRQKLGNENMLAVTRHFSRVKLKKKTRSKEEQVHQILLTTRSIADGGGDSGAAIQGHSSHHYHATLQQEREGEGEKRRRRRRRSNSRSRGNSRSRNRRRRRSMQSKRHRIMPSGEWQNRAALGVQSG